LAEQANAKLCKIDALMNLSAYYHSAGNAGKAFEFLQQATYLKDSLLSETNVKQVNSLAMIYETDKKQKEIIQLQNEKKIQAAAVEQNSTLNKVFITTIIGLLIFGYLAYRTVKSEQKIANQKQEIQKQKISELKKDTQLLTVDAMLKGQEEERSRIAKDLHDGLGGMLSGVKLSFINMKENMILPAENVSGFERSIAMLDNTIAELRKVAHNLMPETLVRFGLDESLKDFCNSIQTSSGIKVVYQQFGEQRKLSPQAEISVYRITQELVNNALKYSEAKQIIVQLTKNHIKTGITVEDNGKGFDVKILDLKKGAGFTNIQYRVNYFKGTLDINSQPGNGTSVSIELMA
jgi:signal transduction histidine kinase